MEVGLKSVENEFRLEYAYDRSEFPLSLAITPYIETYDFEWHFNTKYHSKEQIECLANQFLNFISSFRTKNEFKKDPISPPNLQKSTINSNLEVNN